MGKMARSMGRRATGGVLTPGLERILRYYEGHRGAGAEELAAGLGMKPTSLVRQMYWLMRAGRVPYEEYHRLVREVRSGGSSSGKLVMANRLTDTGGLSVTTVRRDDGRRVDCYAASDEILSLEEILRAAKIDQTRWTVSSHTIQRQATGRYAVRVTLKRNDQAEELLAMRDAVLGEIRRRYSTGVKRTPHKRSRLSGVLLEVSIPDIHIGKLAWGEATADENWDVDIAAERFLWACRELIRRAKPYDVERILLPIGNDFLNSDGADMETTSGTRVSEDSRYQRTWRLARQAAIEAICEAKKTAPVHILIVPGNHDRERIFYFGDVLEARFHSDPEVTVDNSPAMRKYFSWGGVLLGFTHGSEEKLQDLPTIMMSEVDGETLAKAVWREWHLGHWHKKRELKFMPLDEFGGVRIRILPSLCAADEWHALHGYRHRKSSEAYLWHKDEYYLGHLAVTVPER